MNKSLWTRFRNRSRMALLLLIPAMTCAIAEDSEAPAPLDMDKVKVEIEKYYSQAHPEIREYILWTAKTFGPGGMWLNQDAYSALPSETREKKAQYLSTLLEEGEYGRHLCSGIASAGALVDERLVPGLMKVAAFHRENADYDCRPKWMAVASLARQNSDRAVPLLISLVDHGNQNTRKWARAALARKTGQDFEEDKQAWASWWEKQGHDPVDEQFLTPWTPLAAE